MSCLHLTKQLSLTQTVGWNSGFCRLLWLKGKTDNWIGCLFGVLINKECVNFFFLYEQNRNSKALKAFIELAKCKKQLQLWVHAARSWLVSPQAQLTESTPRSVTGHNMQHLQSSLPPSLPIQDRDRCDGHSPAWEPLSQPLCSWCQGDSWVVHLEKLASPEGSQEPSGKVYVCDGGGTWYTSLLGQAVAGTVSNNKALWPQLDHPSAMGPRRELFCSPWPHSWARSRCRGVAQPWRR